MYWNMAQLEILLEQVYFCPLCDGNIKTYAIIVLKDQIEWDWKCANKKCELYDIISHNLCQHGHADKADAAFLLAELTI